jgi:single-strand DNA-binding protein
VNPERTPGKKPEYAPARLQPKAKSGLSVILSSSLQSRYTGAARMAKSVNKVILIGNLGKDPEVKYTPSGMAVARFTLATNERYKDKEGNWQDKTEWHNLVAFQRTAEIVGEYLKKGRSCYVEGRLQTSSWDDKESGQKKYRTEIIVNDLVLLGGREGGEGGSYSGSRGGSKSSDFDQSAPEHDNAPTPHPTEVTDEDIPF